MTFVTSQAWMFFESIGLVTKHPHPHRNPITEPENGIMEPQWPMRFVSVIGHPLLISLENMTRKMPRASTQSIIFVPECWSSHNWNLLLNQQNIEVSPFFQKGTKDSKLRIIHCLVVFIIRAIEKVLSSTIIQGFMVNWSFKPQVIWLTVVTDDFVYLLFKESDLLPSTLHQIQAILGLDFLQPSPISSNRRYPQTMQIGKWYFHPERMFIYPVCKEFVGRVLSCDWCSWYTPTFTHTLLLLLRLVVYPIIYRVLAPSQMVIAGFQPSTVVFWR